MERMKNEIDILKQFKHPNLIAFRAEYKTQVITFLFGQDFTECLVFRQNSTQVKCLFGGTQFRL